MKKKPCFVYVFQKSRSVYILKLLFACATVYLYANVLKEALGLNYKYIPSGMFPFFL
jgi:hypothetical protein